MIRSIQDNGKTLWFVADDMGLPVSFGYATKEQAEEVEALIESSGGQATIPEGVDVEKLAASQR